MNGYSPDYSEGALAYFSYHHPTDPLGLTAGDSTVATYDWTEIGGHTYLPAFAYASGIGPSYEYSAPYSNLVSGYDSSVAYERARMLTGAKWYNRADESMIKQAIQQYGSVGVGFYYDAAYLRNAGGSSYYYQNVKAPEDLNHAVTIIGWNDNISRYSFGTTPSRDGAWLARNSYGEGWGSGGYFWISYAELSLADFRSMEFIPSYSDWDNIYQYDGTGSTWHLTCYPGTSYANVFRAQSDEILDAVSVAFYSANVSYNVQIYKKSSAMSSATDGTAMLSTPISCTTDATGIYMVKLPTAVPLKKGEYYSVAITVNSSAMMFFDRSNSGTFIYTNHCETGQSFSGNFDLANSSRPYCLRIKAYTNNARSYGITYELNGGTNNSANPSSYLNVNTVTLKSPTRPGYTFAGWYISSDFTGSKVTTIPVGSTGDKTFYAKWTLNTYSIKFSANGGTGTMSTLTGRKYGTYYTLPANTFKRTDYAFTGWNTKSDGKGTAIADKASVWNLTATNGGTVTLYAQWKTSLTQYKITYVLNSGKNSSKNPSSYTKKDTVTLSSPTRAGYTFGGWYTNKNFTGSKVTKIAKGSTGNKTFYAKWTPNTYSIKFSANGGTGSMSTLTGRKYGTSYTLPAGTFKRTGYALTGWNTKADGKGTKYANKASVKNLTATNGGTVTLYAQWTSTSKKYSVSYVLNGGKNSSKNPSSYTNASEVTLSNPTKTGYTFGGWYTNKSFTGSKVTKIAKGSSGNKTFYAKWTANTYTIKFNANGGTGSMTSVTATYGKAVTLKACTLKKSGKVFLNWNTKANGSGTSYADKASVKNLTATKEQTVTLYAQWGTKSGWVRASEVPKGATIVDRKWKYTKVETTTSDTLLSGWTKLSESWQKTGTGICKYAYFPSGFYTGHSLYSTYAGKAVTAYENATTKRTVGTPYQSSHIYWHWTYTRGVLPNNNYNCLINSVSGWDWDDGLNYQYFSAFESSTAYSPIASGGSVVYQIWRGNPDDGSWWWFETPIYSVSFEDFKKVYQLEKRTAAESSTKVTPSATAVNVQEYVRYTTK